jgi:phosphoribosylformimino-5-aminoimidazole carboxamide ribotide isomerase
MTIIPVLDLKNGQVVLACRGRRHLYRPLDSTLVKGSEPRRVIEGLRRLCPFRIFYIADLDAIAGNERNRRLLADLVEAFPDLDFWIDRGLAAMPVTTEAGRQRVTTVIGSESLRDAGPLERLSPEARRATVLSLDFQGSRLLGPVILLTATTLWPERLIVLDLRRVGSFEGPCLARLSQLRLAAGSRRLYAGGGVRTIADVRRLDAGGIDGVLIASALHAGRIRPHELRAFA